jgi:hypothetical protein
MLKAELKLKTCGLHIPEPREDVEGRFEVEHSSHSHVPDLGKGVEGRFKMYMWDIISMRQAHIPEPG